MMLKRHSLAYAFMAALCFASAFGFAQTTPDGRFSLSKLGDEIIDVKQGLAFKRCAQAQVWHGKCVGEVQTYTYEQALERAREVSNESGLVWRLPTVKELQSLFNPEMSGPVPAVPWLPKESKGVFWSSSKIPSYADSFWVVEFNSCTLKEASKKVDDHALRLVRSLK